MSTEASRARLPRAAGPAGVSRRHLVLGTGALLVTSGSYAFEPPPEASSFEHKWAFEPIGDAAGEVFATRFGLVRFRRAPSAPRVKLDLGEPEADWKTCPDLAALVRTTHVLFLTGLPAGQTKLEEAITSCATGLVIDLRAARLTDAVNTGASVDDASQCVETVASDFIRAYVQQVVAFDLEDARATLSGAASCHVAVSVAAGVKSARTAFLAAMRQYRGPGEPSRATGQLLLLTFGSQTGCLRLSKEAFSAARANLPTDAASMYAVGIDKELPADTVRATVLTRWY